MRRMIPLLTMSTLALVLAGVSCKRSQDAVRDSSLNRDLELAAHQRDSLDSVSALESRRLASPSKTAYRAEDDPPHRRHVSNSSGEASRSASSSASSSSGSSDATVK